MDLSAAYDTVNLRNVKGKIYNDQPISAKTEHFMYANDVVITAQCDTFEKTEAYLTQALDDLYIYYAENQLKPNPTKTLSCVFHLKIDRQHANSESNEKKWS